MTSRSSRNDRRGKFFGFNTLRVSSSVFEVKILLGLANLFLDTMGWDTLTLRRPLRKSFGWGGFSTFPRWRSRGFLNRTSLTPLTFFIRIFLKIPISVLPLLRPLKNSFCQRDAKKMVNFKLNWCVHKVEKA